MDEMINAEHHKVTQDFMDTSEIVYGYCTEFMVKFEEDKLANNPFNEETFRNELSELGDSLLVVSDEEIVKVHVHSETPGTCLSFGQRFGSLINMKIENMREQHSAIVGKKENNKPKKKEDMPSLLLQWEWLKPLFESLGATVVIEGGQTMNPSTQDIADAINQLMRK